MKVVGRFTVTNLSESGKSDMSTEAKVSINVDDSLEAKTKNAKDSLQSNVKVPTKETTVLPVQKLNGIQETLGANVFIMQYNDLVASHQQFLLDYLNRDALRQEQIQNIIKEILELTERNARLENENLQLKEILQKNQGN